jgi:hypothetical protein
VTHFWDDELTPALHRTLRLVVERGPLSTAELRAAGGSHDTASKLEDKGLVRFQLAQEGRPGAWAATDAGRARAQHGRYGDVAAHKAILAARRAEQPPPPVVRPYSARQAPVRARRPAVRGAGGLRPTLNEIADRITAHLVRIERTPSLNLRPDGTARLLHARAHRAGTHVRVTYVDYQGSAALTREEAEAYLGGLDKGRVGTHVELSRARSDSAGQDGAHPRAQAQKAR